MLKKLADLRQYVDGMAETVFIGQREALESEFAAGLQRRAGTRLAGAGLKRHQPKERELRHHLDHGQRTDSPVVGTPLAVSRQSGSRRRGRVWDW